MNSVNDSLLLRQRCRQWTPLITQQLRLRHLYQILAYNVIVNRQGSLYYTLHLTSMSAPFYTSEKINNANPKWSELDFTNVTHLSATAFVLRIWQKQDNDKDTIILTWGINLSGLVYLGNKLTDLQPDLFKDNSVILQLRGGYFSTIKSVNNNVANNLTLTKNLNVKEIDDDYKIVKYFNINYPSSEIKASYNLEKLRKLHSLQIRIKNKSLDAQLLRDEISSKCALCDNGTLEKTTVRSEPVKNSNVRYAPQLLTMNSLNKMLQEKPTKIQMQEIVKVRKEIEIFKFRTKLLLQEKDRKSANIRQLKNTYTKLSDSNEDIDSKLFENYRKLSKEIEKLKERKREQLHQHEHLIQISSQLHHRRRQLVSQLLMIYPIVEVEKNKYTINNIYLPDADLLADYSDNGLSAALGYVAHILTMCASFLQVPLRYPIIYQGSRSHIIDHVSPQLPDREREFPLYTKGKDRMQFSYAVYLLNKNIAQLRCLYGLNTIELKSTLSNLLFFLQGKEGYRTKSYESLHVNELSKKDASISTKETVDVVNDSSALEKLANLSTPQFSSSSNIPTDLEDQMQYIYITPTRKRSKQKLSETGPGLSEILAVPEAYLNKQITTSTFKNYINNQRLQKTNVCSEGNSLNEVEIKSTNSSANSSVSNLTLKKSNGNVNNVGSKLEKEQVEEGTDLVNTSNFCNTNIIQKRKSRSVGSYTDDENLLDIKNNYEVGSDPLINVSSDTTNSDITNFVDISKTEINQREFLEKWLDNGPALISSEQSLYPEEVLGVEDNSTTTTVPERQLTLRTDALLNTTSFNLVKPKL